ncbi:ABC transporter substrate-binding protein [Actinophytocola algeriensis]|uniref:Peptide/nickel transport system substrate-binding protein n=1 Tax=Actinophytocola algeriensis TaxID=1768010 RepID=A0A7W7QCE7_9PSEU|nr:ABC transporter substrate-binding protein [Actinophytocola algeriensis]MBB4910714.1 peptide/nickel transport system substrate-binding protein [Actinophytocola algeriensis]MBE1473707.1 peptide/nickel transport system substrate-binding protein [Actinophytocola algeriensis]
MRSRLLALGVTLMASALVTAPVAVSASASPAPARAAEATSGQDGKVLRIGVSREVDTLNPFMSITLMGTSILRSQFEFLTTYSQGSMTPEGALAEKWETSEDKLTWTYHIRKDVKWSDGKPVTAKDAAWTFQKMLDDETARTANGSYITQWESVTATDDWTLKIKTKVPQATMDALDIPIVPEHVWSKMSDISAAPEFPMVGNGPYYITEFKEAQFTKMKANKNYWRGAPKVDEIHFVYYSNSDAAVSALQSGEVDLINPLTPTQYDALQGEPDIQLNNAQNRRFNELLINPGAATNDGTPIGNGNPALKDVKLRQAIAQAIDTKTLVDKVWSGYATEAAGYIPPMFKDFAWEPTGDQVRKFDLDAANKALDEAGYKKGQDGVRLDKQGKPLNLRLLTHAERDIDENASPFIKGWLKEIGIEVTIEPKSDNQVNEETTRGEYDLAISGWSANPDPDYVLSLQTCANRPNADGTGATPDSFLCNEEYDELYAKQLSEFDRSKRIDIVKQMQALLYDEATLVIFGYDNALEAFRKDKFEGFPQQPTGSGVIMFQQSYWGLLGATPKGEGPVPVYDGSQGTESGEDTTDAAAEESSNTGLILGIVGGVLVVVLVVGLLVARGRRKTADDRE